MSPPVALIIGAGPNSGIAMAKAFAAKGYSLALAARRLTNGTSPEGYLNFQLDLNNPDNVKTLFATVKEKLGSPSVVAYNGMSPMSSSSSSSSVLETSPPPPLFSSKSQNHSLHFDLQ